MRYQHDPEGTRLPVKLDSTTNGEFAPIPLEPVHHRANAAAHEAADRHAKKLGRSRREFLVSACGAATSLLAMNATYAAAGRRGGYYALPQEAALDAPLAQAALGKREFIFDVQGHFVNPSGAWTQGLPSDARPLSWAPKTDCPLADEPGTRSYLQCLSGDELIKDVFRRMSGRGVAILMSTHTLEVAQEMCDRISIILKGKIIASGTVDDLRVLAGSPDEQLTPVFLKLTGGSALQEIDEIV